MSTSASGGTPWLDTRSKGAIVGLTYATTRGAIAKGILEGLTFELRVNLELLRDAGVGIEELHAVGGGARSALWLALKADICGLPLRSATRELQTRRARRTLTGIYDDAPLQAVPGRRRRSLSDGSLR